MHTGFGQAKRMPPFFTFREEQKHNSQCIITYNIKEVGGEGAGEKFHYLERAYIDSRFNELSFLCKSRPS